MHVIITGCAGFIGSHLSERLLNEGHTVTGIDNFDPFYPKEIKLRNLEASAGFAGFLFIEADICDPQSYRHFPDKADVVVHIAAKAGVRPSVESPQAYIDVNITGTHQVLDWMRLKGVSKIVFASSSSVYGNNKVVPFSENHPVDHPISPYAFTKKAGELLTHTYHHLYNIGVINLRFFTVYGPRQRPDLAIRKFVQRIKSGKAITLFGDGSTSRDYTYVADTVQGIVQAIDYLNTHPDTYETINLGNSSPVTLHQLVDTLYFILNSKKNVKYAPMQEGDVERTYADISKARSLLGYSPSTSLEEGLQKFVEWYDMHADEI